MIGRRFLLGTALSKLDNCVKKNTLETQVKICTPSNKKGCL